MKTKNTPFKSPKINFKISKKDTNNNFALLPNALQKKLQIFINEVIINNPKIKFSHPELVKLQILKNTFLNDEISITAQHQLLSSKKMLLHTFVVQTNKRKNTTVCKASFKIDLEHYYKKAS